MTKLILSVKLDPADKKLFSEFCAKKRMTMSDVVRMLVFERIEKENRSEVN